MSLVSYPFLLFLGLLVVLYYLLPGRHQWKLLLAASILFYCCAGLKGLLFPGISAVSTWGLALAIGKTEKGSRRRKPLLVLGILLNIGLLAVLKYTNFALDNISWLSGRAEDPLPHVDWILPLGISYYTFQALGYLIDVYREKISPERSIARYALFVSFFPQMVQGPICRYDEMDSQLFAEHRYDGGAFRRGSVRLLWGYFKKLVVADRIAPLAAAVSQAPDGFGGLYVFLGMVIYTIWMYADFSGGIDIVLGAAGMMQIRMPENFDRPFLSGSLSEFWRRWHMSLMRWVREYIFFPVSASRAVSGLSAKVRKHFGKNAGRRVPLYFASFTVWLVVGIWHGASWNFVIWGLANCIALLISQEMSVWSKKFRKAHPFTKGQAYRCFQVTRTFFLFCMLEMVEFYPLSRIPGLLVSMIADFRPRQLFDGTLFALGLTGPDAAVLSAAVALMVWAGITGDKAAIYDRIAGEPRRVRAALIYALFLCVLIFGAYGHGYTLSQFIYNQF